MTEIATEIKGTKDEDSALLGQLCEALAEKVIMRVGVPEYGMRYERTGQCLHVTVSFDMFQQLEYMQAPVH